MMKCYKGFLWVILFMGMVSWGTWPGKPCLAAEPIKVAVIPSVLNLCLQYNTLQGNLEEDAYLFSLTLEAIQQGIRSKSSFALSSQTFADNADAANAFMQSQPYPNTTTAFDADLLVLIGNADDRPKTIEVFVVAVETGRGVSSFIDLKGITNAQLTEQLQEKIAACLDQAQALLNVEAERMADPRNSIVEYHLTGLLNEEVLAGIDYDQTHANIKHVSLFLKNPARVSNEISVELPTVDNHKIKITYLMINGEVLDVRFDVDFRPADADSTSGQAFTVLSKNGYKLVFKFLFANGAVKNVDIYPQTNPYLPHLLEDI